MSIKKKVLICGGGVAGPTCAWFLARYGYSVVIAEKAASLRDGGQNVDIKGAGQQVIGQMGLLEQIEACNTGELGQRYLDEFGKVIASIPRGGFGTLTSDYEILRGDFAKTLHEATCDCCEYRFNTSVIRLEDYPDGIVVTFADNCKERFDLVICAEGINSSTRAMVLGDETRFRYLGAYMAFFKIPRRAEDDDWAWTVNGIGGTFITLRPGGATETTVLVTFPRDGDGVPKEDRVARKGMLRDALIGRGSIAERIVADLDTVEDFYFGPMSQVQASTWSKGRVVLLGDAAHCPTPFTGRGTALALVGAYVLAGEISHNQNLATAFASYEQLVRPYAEKAQRQLNRTIVRLIHVKSKPSIALTRSIERLLAMRFTQSLLRSNEAARANAVNEDFVLPSYQMNR